MATASNSMPSSGNKDTPFILWWRRTAYTRAAYLYLVPAILVMTVITFYPMIYQIWMSFTDYGVQNLRGNPPALVGIKNYIDIFSGALSVKLPNYSFVRILTFNLIWTFVNVPVHVALGVLIALLLNSQGLWFKRFYRAVYVLPMVLPWLVVATVWKNMFDQDYGSINMFLSWIGSFFGVPAEAFRIRWMENIYPPISASLTLVPLPLSFYAMWITNIWMGWPLNTIVATGALQSIPKDLYEAASIDGANGIQQFFAITMPLLRPAMVPAAMVGTIITFNLFNCIYFMSSGGPLRMTQILVTTVFDLAYTQRMYGMAAAFSMIIFVILLILTTITNKITQATERYDV